MLANRFGRRVMLAWVGSALLLAACGGSGARDVGGGAPGLAGAPATPGSGKGQVLHLGYLPNITHATAIVGVERGIFAEQLGASVRLETSTFAAGPAEVEALFSGALDAAYIGPNPAVTAYVQSKGAAVRLVAGAASGGASLVVSPAISGAQDLRGKRLASPQLGNTQDVALRTWLKAQGLRTDAQGGGDVAIVPQDNAQTLTAFRSGQIAGAWLPEPWATRLVVEGGGMRLVDERTLWPNGQFATTVLVVRTSYLQQHPDVVTRLLHGHLEATAYLQDHPAEAQQTVNDSISRLAGSKLTDAVMSQAWSELGFTADPVASSVLKSAQDAANLGFLDLGGVDLRGLFALDPLNTLLKANGSPEVAAP